MGSLDSLPTRGLSWWRAARVVCSKYGASCSMSGNWVSIPMFNAWGSDTLLNGLWQEHTTIQWSCHGEKPMCHVWTGGQHKGKTIQCRRGHLVSSHPAKTRNTELPRIEGKATPNANIKTQCCLPSTKFSSRTANWFCIKIFGSFKDETCYSLHTTSHFKKPPYNFPCHKTFKKYGDMNWMNSIGITSCIMLLTSDLVNGFNDDKRHWKCSASLHIMGM